MFQPPSSQVPSGGNLLYDSANANQLSQQMQDMKLSAPIPQSPAASPMHRPPPSATNVTYSSQPNTYPYVNNNPPPGSSPTSPQRPKSSLSSPLMPPKYNNGISNGHSSPLMSSPQHQPNSNYQMPQSPYQRPPLGPSTPMGNPPPQFQGSPMGPPGPGKPPSQMQGPPGLIPNQGPGNLPPQFQGPGKPPSQMQGPPGSMPNQGPGNLSSPFQGPGKPPSQMQGPPGSIPNQGPGNLPPQFQGPPAPSMGPPGPQFQGTPMGPPGPMPSHPPSQFQGSSTPSSGPRGQIPPPQPGFQPFPGQSPPGSFSQPPGSFPPGSPPYQGMPPMGTPGSLPPAPQYGSSPPPGPQNWQGGPYPAGQPGSYPYGAANPGQQQPASLGIDQMPSNVLVREEDRKCNSGYFVTNAKGQVPPMVTTNFVAQDRGMCSPRFIRSSLYILPNNPDILKQCALPFAITINPLSSVNEGEDDPPTCLYREQGPLRCKRCKAYICPFMTFMEGGRCFQCAFCKVVTEVPQDYFCFLDGIGERTDKYHRPELCFGSYEYLATKEYCRKDELPNPPAYIFMIEVSTATFRNGLIPLLCESMKQVLKTLQTDERTDNSKLRVGFVTYNNVLHFYNMKKNLTQPHIMVLSDVHNAFVPLLEGFLVTLDEAECLVDSLMEHIPRLFMNEPSTEIILGPVVQVGLEALKNANCSGKLLVFHSTIPNADAPGKLPHRDGQKLLGTDKQKTVLAPQTDFYTKLAQDCVAAGCAVDIFLFPSAYVDIASLSPLCRHTGGQIFKYTYFQSHVDGSRFLSDLETSLTTPTAFDAVLRVRTSAGISPVFYYGNFYMSNATDIELSAVDSHKSVTVEFAYDEKLPENETVFIQAALLYTTCTGERRIRVHNLALPTTVSMADVYKGCEMDAIINFLAKHALKSLLDHSPQQMKTNLLNRCAKILSCYRKQCSQPSGSRQLILPESLRLLPLYANCLLKSDAINGGSEMSLDDRSFAMLCVNSMDVLSTVTYFYPTLIPVHNVDPDATYVPSPIRCAIQKLSDDGAYILENGIYMFLWIGQSISSDWLQNVFGVQSTNQIDKAALPELDTPLSKRIRQIIDDLEYGRQRYMKLSIMVQGDKLEIVFRQFLVEDRGADGSLSYVDFLCHLHKEISSNP